MEKEHGTKRQEHQKERKKDGKERDKRGGERRWAGMTLENGVGEWKRECGREWRQRKKSTEKKDIDNLGRSNGQWQMNGRRKEVKRDMM